jgi:hypothetical protein
MFKTPKAIGWICAAVGAVMLAGTAGASAQDGAGIPRYQNENIFGSPSYRGQSGHSYRHHDYRRGDHRRGHKRYKHRRGGPNVGIYLGIPSYRYVEPRRYAPRVSVSRAHINWCENRYRSYRAWDNTFQPYNGPRRQCWSPYS